jgi:hypothetical protein
LTVAASSPMTTTGPEKALPEFPGRAFIRIMTS